MTTNEESSGNPTPQFALQKIYLKDISFETPNSPESFTHKWEPDINIELNTSGKQLAQDVHEVVLGVTVTAKLADKVAYLVEVHQAGIFGISGYSDQDKDLMLGAYCPNILFPYVRETVSDLVNRGGFPQILLQPVNFEAIYQEHLKQRSQAEAQSATTENTEKVH